ALEARQGLRIFGHVIRQKFQRDKAQQAGVLGLVDDTHTPAAEFLDDAVMRDDLVDHYEMSGCWSPHVKDAASVRQRIPLLARHEARGTFVFNEVSEGSC